MQTIKPHRETSFALISVLEYNQNTCNSECRVILLKCCFSPLSHLLCHDFVPVCSYQHAPVKSRDYMNYAI